MKINELKINQQVLYQDKRVTVVRIHKDSKLVVINICDNTGKSVKLAKVKSSVLKPYFCTDLNKDCDAKGLPLSVILEPCDDCKSKNKGK